MWMLSFFQQNVFLEVLRRLQIYFGHFWAEDPPNRFSWEIYQCSPFPCRKSDGQLILHDF